MQIDLKEIQKGDVFSELSHYTFQRIEKGSYVFLHHASNSEVTLSDEYVEKLLISGNIYTNIENVGREDKYWTAKQIETAFTKGEIDSTVREGDIRVKGIRSIWEEIHSQHVFTVCFQKQHTTLSAKKYAELQNAQLVLAIDAIEKAAKSKKGVANAAEIAIKEIQSNPILPIQEGEDRILTGYKIQFQSRDGKYDCMDMAISEPRPVNINTIKWLIYKGTKFVVS